MSATDQHQRVECEYRLGIDLGSGSIGWAAIAETHGQPAGILAMGVRCFEAGVLGDVEQGKDESRGTARREARGPRRLTWRRQYRLRKVFRLLQRMDLLPASTDDSHDERNRVLAELDAKLRRGLPAGDARAGHQKLPYLLRARALKRKLSRHELGRALYHLAQRRGFLSNLKAAKEDEDLGKVKKGISELQALMDQAGAETLGQYLASLDPEESRIRGRYTARAMYEREFERIWSAQAAHHADLTDERKEQLHHAIFHQRKLKSQRGLVGRCELEPEKRRAPAACLEFQQFRILQKVNDLEVIEPGGECRPLSAEERSKLLEEMAENGEVTFGRMRTLLKMRKSKEYGRNYTFNFEASGEKRLVGNRTAAKLVAILGDWWRELTPQQQKQLVDEKLSFESEDPLVTRLTNGWGLDEPTARRVAETPLEQGYGSHSRRALRRLTEEMQKPDPDPDLPGRYTQYAKARDRAYPDSRKAVAEEETLPAQHNCAVLRDLRNPAVARALSEMRKVVNALIRRCGKPREIHVELARDLKHARKLRQAMADQNKANQKARNDARAEILKEMGDERFCTERNALKVRLAEECDWTCPYTGKRFGMRELVGDHPQVDIEHIIPFSRCLDNSYMNKTLCFVDENRKRKGGQTPYEAYHGTDRWEEILARVRMFKADAKVRRRKLQLFTTEKLPDQEDFDARQLNDTRYMSRLAADYLGLLYGGRVDGQGKLRVQVSPGRVTKYLRERWNLNSILGHPDNKNRADHRHHAIDAVVIALSGAGEVHRLSRAAEEAEHMNLPGLFPRGECFDSPWEGFLDDTRRGVEAINVSWRVSRKLSGKLHKETNFSKPVVTTDGRGKRSESHHVRKRLESLTADQVGKIVDGRIRAIVQEHLERHGGDLKKAFADPNNHPYATSRDGRVIPIHKVRIRESVSTIEVGRGSRRRYVAPGANHHMEIVAVLDKDGREKRWEGHVVSLFEAVARRRRGEPVIQRDHGQGKRFKFSLAGGEHVVMQHVAENDQLFRVAVISGNRVEFRLHSDARPSTLLKKTSGARIILSVDPLRKAHARKVAVDPLGNVLPAHD